MGLILPLQIVEHPLSFTFWANILVIAGLLFLSGLVSGSEVAFFSLTHKDLKRLKEHGGYTGMAVVKLMETPRFLLSTILIANNLINIAIIITSSYVLFTWFNLTPYPFLEFFVEVILITFLILLFGEITPKTYATQNNDKLAEFMAVPFAVLKKIFYPLNLLLVSSTTLLERRIDQQKHNITLEELDHAIDLTSQSATQEEKKILKELLSFGNIAVKQIMVNRVDVLAIPNKMEFDKLLKTIKKEGYSRIPVYKDTFDNVEGILYTKDLLEHLNGGEDIHWPQLIRPPFFVPETKKIGDLLKEFQQKKVHLAIVVDEYGGSSGIVTLEDILEEIVGDIKDEYDKEEPSFVKIDKDNYIFKGKTLLSDLTDFFELPDTYFDEVKGEADSLAGLILELAGKLPQRKEKIQFGLFTFVVESVSKKRINKIRLIISSEVEEETSEPPSEQAPEQKAPDKN